MCLIDKVTLYGFRVIYGFEFLIKTANCVCCSDVQRERVLLFWYITAKNTITTFLCLATGTLTELTVDEVEELEFELVGTVHKISDMKMCQAV